MSLDTLLQTVTEIFVEVLGKKDITLNNETTAGDVAEWDSLNHVQLMAAVEKHFNIRFTTREIMGLKNIGDLCQKIQEKLRH